MKKLKTIIKEPRFWGYALISAAIALAIETFFLGLWSLPIIHYRIAYMSEIKIVDYAFIGIFAAFWGFGAALFFLNRKFSKFACSSGSVSGLLGLFTLLCPVCPIFFLSYFGLSATLLFAAPYFWWIRAVALVIILAALVILYKSFAIKKFPKLKQIEIFHNLGIALVIILFFTNQSLALQLGDKMMGPQPGEKIQVSGDFSRDIANLTTPSDIPFYGPELGLDFSSINAINDSIAKLSVFAPQQGSKPIQLNEEEMKRYIAIGTEPTVTCEFCCGAKTLLFDDGSPSCGCAHSIAMRGTAAYLLKNYPELSNADIAYELMRQKGLYFPKQMQERMAKELAGDSKNFTADITYLTQQLSTADLAALQRKAKSSGFTPDASTEMVGGC